MLKTRYYFFVTLIFFLLWAPGSLEFSLGLHSQENLMIGKITNILFYIPFLIAFISGYYFGYRVISKLAIIALMAAVIDVSIYVFDLSSIDGGWSVYGSWFSLSFFALVLVIGIILSTLFGAALSLAMKRKGLLKY